MRAYRLCRSNYPPYDGEGARRAGGRWNFRGNAVVYMSENRSLALVGILVHLSSVIPDRYVLGAAEIPDDLAVDHVAESELPSNWAMLDPSDQSATRAIGPPPGSSCVIQDRTFSRSRHRGRIKSG
jgi:RES domain-containing protein